MKKENAVIESKNLGTFYKFVNKRLKYRNVIGALVDDCGNIITNDDEKAKLFNDYFASVGDWELSIIMSFQFATLYYMMIVYWTRQSLTL